MTTSRGCAIFGNHRFRSASCEEASRTRVPVARRAKYLNDMDGPRGREFETDNPIVNSISALSFCFYGFGALKMLKSLKTS